MEEVRALGEIRWEADKWSEALGVGEDDRQAFAELVERAKAVARPAYALRQVKAAVLGEDAVALGGKTFSSRVMARNLKDCDIAVAYVITCGSAMHGLYVSESDPLAQYWCDFICYRLLNQAMEAARDRARELLGHNELSAMSPGSLADWPISAQHDLFSLFECDMAGEVGVTLTESFLMIPFKSVSGVFFSGKEHYTNCSLCPRIDCPNRREPHDSEKAEVYGV